MNGQVSLGHAALMAVGGYSVAMVQKAFTDHNASGQWLLPVSLLAGTLITAVVGGVIGVAAARLRGPYLAGATLALGVALPSITSHYTSVFKGDQGLFVTFAGPPASFGANFALERWQAWISLGAALIVLLLLANLARSAVGRNLRAVRDDEIAAQLAGLSVARVRVLAFSVSSAAAGLGGGVFAVVLQNASPGSFDLTLSLTLLSAVVIGGLGSLTGAVWGSIVVVYLGIVLRGWVDRLHLSAASTQRLHDNLPNGVYGLLLVVMMLALPGGIQSLVRRVGALIPRRSVPPTGGQE
jgi:branched-chain amino acid transport system permease protein